MRSIVVLIGMLIATGLGALSPNHIHSRRPPVLERRASRPASASYPGALHKRGPNFDSLPGVSLDGKKYKVAWMGPNGLTAMEPGPRQTVIHGSYVHIKFQNDSPGRLRYMAANRPGSELVLDLAPNARGSLPLNPTNPWIVITDDPDALLSNDVYSRVLDTFHAQGKPRPDRC